MQKKFRDIGHPDWIPDEENKKTKKGIIGKLISW
jgi:hypothetical protein